MQNEGITEAYAPYASDLVHAAAMVVVVAVEVQVEVVVVVYAAPLQSSSIDEV